MFSIMSIMGLLFIVGGAIAYDERKILGIMSFIIGLALMLGSIIVSLNYEIPKESIRVESELVSDSTLRIYNHIIINK